MTHISAYEARERLVIFDADGTTVDAFHAIETAFSRHGMDIGDLTRFQKRRRLLKYLGGLRELPGNLRKQFSKQSRKRLLATLTEVYREEARLYPGIPQLLRTLFAAPGIRVALVTRNVTNDPGETLRSLFARHDIDIDAFDAFECLPLSTKKSAHFREIRERFAINPARAFACGDEYGDYAAAIATGMHPFIVAYGFEDQQRLTDEFAVPYEIVSGTPAEFAQRLLHGLDLAPAA